MKLDFLNFGEGGGGGATAPLPRRTIERRMRLLDIQPLDSARRTVRLGVVAGLAFVGLLLLFAFLAPISAAAIAPALVMVSGDKYAVQPVASGMVTQVMVREGQLVRAGQPLVRLNGIRSGAQLQQVQARVDSLRSLEARLTAERSGAEDLVFPQALTQRSFDPAARRAMTSQQAIFARHRALQLADRQDSEQALLAARAKLTSSDKQLGLLRDELEDYRSLYEKGFARKTTIRSLEQNEAQLLADRTTGSASLRQAEIARARVRDAQAMDLASQLSQVQDQLAQITPQLDVTRYMADQDVVRAPTDGRVSGVVEMGPGMLIGAGRTLMEIVPSGRPLIVEARVKPADIDDVRVGQEATVRFSTVNPHGKTAFKGHVVTLSPAQIEGQGGAYFKAQIALDDAADARREGLTLTPGVPASVTIKTKDRTLFAYLFAPFTDAMSRAFREE